MQVINYQMKPQDIVILLKIIATGNDNWQQLPLADNLRMSQSEVSQAIARMRYAGLMQENGKQVMRLALMEFLQHGIVYVFPQRPGAVVRGVPTAHAAFPLNQKITSDEVYVWPSAKGNMRGQAITPLYHTVPHAIEIDEKFYALIALVDALRVGQKREKELALAELKKRILHGE